MRVVFASAPLPNLLLRITIYSYFCLPIIHSYEARSGEGGPYYDRLGRSAVKEKRPCKKPPPLIRQPPWPFGPHVCVIFYLLSRYMRPVGP